MHEFAHGGANDGHFGFAGLLETLTESPDGGVIAHGDDGGHIQGFPQIWITGFGQSCSAP